ncbi:isochorismatase family protein [Burkholderia contaminans]|nr:isochorismatase family protein [Burkholderia contaminans]
MQAGLFHGPNCPHDSERTIANANRLISTAYEAGEPVFAVRHTRSAARPPVAAFA